MRKPNYMFAKKGNFQFLSSSLYSCLRFTFGVPKMKFKLFICLIRIDVDTTLLVFLLGLLIMP